ncbi:hypothetical protein V2J09_006712 [Rumex salicifolius]
MSSSQTPILPDSLTGDDLELSLAISASYDDNQPTPSSDYSVQQNHQYNNNYQVKPNLQPFTFFQLPTNNSPIICLQHPIPPPPPVLENNHHQGPPPQVPPPPTTSMNQPRRQQARTPKAGSSRKKSETITPPFPWSTDKRCRIYTLRTLKSRGHVSIRGRVKCRKCEQSYEMSFDLDDKFVEVANYVLKNKDRLCHRAPAIWTNPELPRCRFCGQESSVKPEMAGKKKNTNWLFLFLGQLLGCCTGEQLKYFCKHNGHHRTAAKDRLLYLAYLNICMQLAPEGPFKL